MEPEKKAKKKLPKKAKTAIIIIAAVLFTLGLAAGAYYLFFWQPPAPEVVLTDAEFLMETESWEKEDAPSVIWSFNEHGTGQLTTNKKNYYDIKWSLEEGEVYTLHIKTSWLYELDDTFEFTLDREAPSFKVKNLADDTESVFVPLGTAERHAFERPSESEKSEESGSSTELEKPEE